MVPAGTDVDTTVPAATMHPVPVPAIENRTFADPGVCTNHDRFECGLIGGTPLAARKQFMLPAAAQQARPASDETVFLNPRGSDQGIRADVDALFQPRRPPAEQHAKLNGHFGGTVIESPPIETAPQKDPRHAGQERKRVAPKAEADLRVPAQLRSARHIAPGNAAMARARPFNTCLIISVCPRLAEGIVRTLPSD